MSLRKQILVDAGSSWVNMAISMIVNLALIPFMLSKVGVSGFGVWALLANGLAYPMILERSFGLAINRFVAFYREDISERNRFISASFLILAGMSILTTFAAVILSFYLTRIFSAIPDELAHDAQITCILVGITLSVKMLESNFSGALRGFQHYAYCNIVMTIADLLRGLLTVILLIYWKNIIGIQIAYVVSAVVSALLMFLTAKKYVKGLRVNVLEVTRKTVRELFVYTIHSIARSGSTVVMQNTLMLLVGWKGTAADVTVYNIASRLPNFVRGVLVATQNVFLPAVTSLSAKGQLESIRSIVKKGTKINVVLTLMSSLLLFIFAPEILNLWLRGNVPEGTVTVVRLLVLSVIPGGCFEIWLPTLVGMGFLSGLTYRSLVTASLAIVLGLIFLQGVFPVPVAPAMALVIALWFGTGLWLPAYGLKKLEIGVWDYFRSSLLSPLFAGGLSVIILWALGKISAFIEINWVFTLIAAGIIITVSFILIALRAEFAEVMISVRRKFGLHTE